MSKARFVDSVTAFNNVVDASSIVRIGPVNKRFLISELDGYTSLEVCNNIIDVTQDELHDVMNILPSLRSATFMVTMTTETDTDYIATVVTHLRKLLSGSDRRHINMQFACKGVPMISIKRNDVDNFFQISKNVTARNADIMRPVISLLAERNFERVVISYDQTCLVEAMGDIICQCSMQGLTVEVPRATSSFDHKHVVAPSATTQAEQRSTRRSQQPSRGRGRGRGDANPRFESRRRDYDSSTAPTSSEFSFLDDESPY